MSIVEERRTDRDYRGELAELRERLLMMGAKVEDMLTGCARAFTRRDDEAAHSTIALDREVDALEIEIDAQCLRVLALRAGCRTSARPSSESAIKR